MTVAEYGHLFGLQKQDAHRQLIRQAAWTRREQRLGRYRW